MKGLRKAAGAVVIGGALALAMLGCQGAVPTATPDIPATVSAQVGSTVAAIPTPMPTANMVATRIATNQSINSTVAARIRDYEEAMEPVPTPTRTAAQGTALARDVWRCLSQHPEYMESFWGFVISALESEGLPASFASVADAFDDLMADEDAFVKVLGTGDLELLESLAQIQPTSCHS